MEGEHRMRISFSAVLKNKLGTYQFTQSLPKFLFPFSESVIIVHYGDMLCPVGGGGGGGGLNIG